MGKDINNIKSLFLKLLPAQVFVVITSMLSGLISGLITGSHLNSDSMVALGLVLPLTSIVGAVAMIVSGGVGVLSGRFMGMGQVKKLNNVFSTAVLFASIIGIAFAVTAFVFSNQLAILFGANEATLLYTSTYIRGLAIGLIPMLIVPTFMTFLQMCNKSSISLVATILLACFNICFALLSINVFNLGIFGIGISTSLSQVLSMLAIIIYFVAKKDIATFSLKMFEKNILLDIIKLGSPACLANFLYSIRNIFINKYALSVGGLGAVNALSIMNSCAFLDSVNIGLASTVTMLASVFAGERDSKSIKGLAKVAIITGEIIDAVRIVLVFFLSERISILFGAQGEVIKLSKDLLFIYNLASPFNILVCTLISSNQSLGKVAYCNFVYLFNCIITPLLCCVTLTKVIGIYGVFVCYALAEIVSLIIMIIATSIINKAPVKSFYDLIHFDSNFEIKDKMSISINDAKGVVEVSEKIQAFCKTKGIDSKRSMLAGLCMEEMAGNVVEHGFDKDNIENTIDIFVHIIDNEISMRLRDNCVPFDPKSKLEMYDSNDPTKNIGIKLVTKIAKSMNYQTTFGLNVLTIKL